MKLKLFIHVSAQAFCMGMVLGGVGSTAVAQGAAATAANHPVSAGTQAASDSSGSGTEIQEIVVTALRREEDIQKVPQAVSVLSGAVQRLRGETGLADLQASVPNLVFSFTSNTSQIFIRGVGDIFVNAGGDPGVAFYQDDAYVSDQTTINTSMFDTDRTEVLRGAQGGLYGKNAVGGAVNVISNKPTDAFSAFISGEVGDYGRRDTEGYISGPLGVADTDFRISYQVRNNDGYTKNLVAGQAGAPDSLDDLHTQAFRIQTLTHLPTGGTLNLLYSDYNEAENGPALAVKPANGFVYPAQLLFGDIPPSDPRVTSAFEGSYKAKVSTANLRYVQPLGAYTLTVVGNYRSSAQTMLNDCSGTNSPACTYYRPTFAQDYYADAHLASPSADRLRWILGATYVNFRTNQIDYVPLISLASYFIPGSAPNAPFPITVLEGGVIDTQSYAAYATAHYQISEIFSLNGEIRYNQTTKNAVQFEDIPQFGVSIAGYTGPGSYLKNISVPYKIGGEAQVLPDLILYADYATAYKDGAINNGALQTTTIKPEQVKTWEFGEKGTFFDRRLQINSAIFSNDYTNLQITQIFNASTILTNVPKSKIDGAELEVVVQPISGLQLSANAGYLDAKFLKFSNSPTIPGGDGPVQNLAGNQLPYDSKFSVNLDGAYHFPITSALNGQVDLQYSWRDRIFFDEFNTIGNSQAAVGVLNLSGSIAPGDGPWRVYAWIHNLTNETINTGTTIYSASLGAEHALEFAPPREFAVGVSYKY